MRLSSSSMTSSFTTMRAFLTAVLVTFHALTSLSCGQQTQQPNHDSDAQQTQQPKLNQPLPDVEPLTVRLINSGDEPHRTLRYDLHSGKSSETILVLHNYLSRRIDFDRNTKDTPMPPIHVYLRNEVLATDNVLTSSIRMTVLNIDVQQGEEIGPAGVAHFQRFFSRVIGLRIDQSFDLSGTHSVIEYDASEIEGDENESVEAWTALNTIYSVSSVVIPLPSEPVGVGAIWQIAGDGVDYGYGVLIPQVNTYTLREMADSTLVVDVVEEMTLHEGVDVSDQYDLSAGYSVKLNRYKVHNATQYTLILNQVGYLMFNDHSSMEIDKVLSDAAGNSTNEEIAMASRSTGRRTTSIDDMGDAEWKEAASFLMKLLSPAASSENQEAAPTTD